jgi:hypothetical protein
MYGKKGPVEPAEPVSEPSARTPFNATARMSVESATRTTRHLAAAVVDGEEVAIFWVEFSSLYYLCIKNMDIVV